MNLKQKFKSAIRRGTGETHILIKENPNIDFSKYIIEAASFNFAYDQQSEGGREVYIAELIELSNQKFKILPIIYKALKTESNDDWSIEQLFDIAAIFAKKGDYRAKKAVHRNYYKWTINGSDWCGQDAIVEIDGLEGLKYVAETKGKFLTENVEEWEDSWFADNFQEENPSIDVFSELRKAAENNSYIKKYLYSIEIHKFSVGKWKKTKYNYENIKVKIDNGKNVYLPTYAINDLSEKDIKNLADDFSNETDRIKQEKYMRIFSRVKFPYEYEPILKLAKARNSRNDRLVEFAVEALKFFIAEDIRQFAIEKLSKTNEPATYTNLLIGNYKKGDWKLLKSIVEKYKSVDIIHSLGWSYIDIYKANSTKECKESLEIIYDKMTCGLHRKDLVKILIENNVLSKKIKQEIQFDCNEEVRKLF